MTGAMRADTGCVAVGGAPLSDAVAGTGPAVGLIHEGHADSRMYDDQVHALAQRYSVVYYDQHVLEEQAPVLTA